MTAEFEKDAFRDLASLAEPPRRSGSIVLVLLVAGALVAVALALMALGRVQAQPYILGLLALLAMIGLFSLFAFAAGILRFADRAADDPVTSRISDHAFDGLAVTDGRGKVVYFNAAYLLVTRRLCDKVAVTARVEAFNTREHGSEMSPLDSEDGWSSTVAARYSLTNNLTLFAEALNVRSKRGVRATDLGINPFQAQTVFQLALRFRL